MHFSLSKVFHPVAYALLGLQRILFWKAETFALGIFFHMWEKITVFFITADIFYAIMVVVNIVMISLIFLF